MASSTHFFPSFSISFVGSSKDSEPRRRCPNRCPARPLTSTTGRRGPSNPGRSASRQTSLSAAFARADAATESRIKEVTVRTFQEALDSAGDRLVVVDMYTQWCGPCKVLAPRVEALAEQFKDVVFLKLDCNEDNKALAKSLGIRVVPTFKLLRNSVVVAEVEGAKYDALVAHIMRLHVTPEDGTAAAAGLQPPVLQEGIVTEVDKDSFYGALREAGRRLVVLDMFTDWCGPCKLIAPKLDKLAEEADGVVFLKLNCNDFNKPLAKALGIVSVPTFKFFKGLEAIDEVRGAKYDLLLQKINEHC